MEKQMTAYLKEILAHEVYKLLDIEKAILKKRVLEDVNKLVDKVFYEMILKLESSYYEIILQSLNKMLANCPNSLVNNDPEDNNVSDGEQPNNQMNAIQAEDDVDDVEEAADDDDIDATEEFETNVLNEDESATANSIIDDTETVSQTNDQGGELITIDDEDTEENDNFEENDYDDENSMDETSADVSLLENNDEQLEEDEFDAMYEKSESDGQERSQQPNQQTSQNGNGPTYFSRKRKIPKMTIDTNAEMKSESSHIRFGIVCTIKGCKEICDYKAELDQHMLIAHGINPYVCVLRGCSRSFADVSQLVVHTNTSHKDVKTWVCKDCQKENDSCSRLQQHHYTAHYQRIFRCSVSGCKFSAPCRRDALRHFQVYHTQAYREMKAARALKQYTCPYNGCGKVFTERTNLRTHKRFHSRSKPFGCSWPQCRYLSEDRANTIRHIRVRHLRLPATVKEQIEKGIANDQDPRQWLQIFNEKF